MSTQQRRRIKIPMLVTVETYIDDQGKETVGTVETPYQDQVQRAFERYKAGRVSFTDD